MSEHQWVRIPNGSLELEGILVPGSAGRVGGVICHPHPLYGGDMHNPVVRAIEAGLQRIGATTLRFNFRGTGESTGVHDHGRGERDDLASAIAFVRARGGVEPLIVAGYSFGAMVALSSADTACEAQIAVAPPLAMMPHDSVASATPQLIVVGDRDAYCSVGQARAAVADHPTRTLHVIEGADHFLFGFADNVSATIANYLGQTLSDKTELTARRAS